MVLADELVDSKIFEALIPPSKMKGRIGKDFITPPRKLPTKSSFKHKTSPPKGQFRWVPGEFDEGTITSIGTRGGDSNDPDNALYYSQIDIDGRAVLMGYLYIPSLRYSTVSIYGQSQKREYDGNRYQYMSALDKNVRDMILRLRMSMTTEELLKLGFIDVPPGSN